MKSCAEMGNKILSKNYTKFINIIFGQPADLLSIKHRGIFTTVIPGL
jgi:hypothetical protein